MVTGPKADLYQNAQSASYLPLTLLYDLECVAKKWCALCHHSSVYSKHKNRHEYLLALLIYHLLWHSF